MQRTTAPFLAWILSVFFMLSIAAPAFSVTENITPLCMTQAISQISNKDHHPCCQQLENHCAAEQCDCDTGHSGNSLLITPSLSLGFNKHSMLKQPLSFRFISNPSASLYRPPKIISC